MQPYEPSLDWGTEVFESLQWVLIAWSISAVSVLAVAALIARYTNWGRQFWRVTGDYFVGRDSVPVWAMVGAILLSVVISVRIDVLFSYYYNDMYSALQAAFQGAGAGDEVLRESGVRGFWFAILTFCVLAMFFIARIVLDLYLTQRFIIRWRVWLTDRLTGDWLQGRAYYRGRFTDANIDNPDQRIQQDIDIFTTGVGTGTNIPSYYSGNTLLFGAVQSVVSVISFTTILWTLSGTLTIFGLGIPKALFWIVLLYVMVATVVAFWIGRPLTRYSFRNELFNAAFRYALVRLRDASEAVAFYRGERAERVPLDSRFSETIANYRRYVRRTVGFLGWNYSMSQASHPLPYIVQAPRLFAGAITFGGVRQSAAAFVSIEDSLSFFRTVYDQFASYRASLIRLNGLLDVNEKARDLPVLMNNTIDGVVELRDVEVCTPTGERLIGALDVRLEPGDSLVITGRSGSGKTTLLRSLAQLWPFASGTLRRPDDTKTMFVSQLPYVPLGDLRAVVSYPLRPGEIPDQELRDALTMVSLGHLSGRLGEVADWAKVLSPGEQQRVAFARILIAKPTAVFLDESTSALDEGLQFALYQTLRTELPECIIVSVSHRSSVEQHHQKYLRIVGEGQWRLGPVEKKAEPV